MTLRPDCRPLGERPDTLLRRRPVLGWLFRVARRSGARNSAMIGLMSRTGVPLIASGSETNSPIARISAIMQTFPNDMDSMSAEVGGAATNLGGGLCTRRSTVYRRSLVD
jgi:hypothetical protein